MTNSTRIMIIGILRYVTAPLFGVVIGLAICLNFLFDLEEVQEQANDAEVLVTQMIRAQEKVLEHQDNLSRSQSEILHIINVMFMRDSILASKVDGPTKQYVQMEMIAINYALDSALRSNLADSITTRIGSLENALKSDPSKALAVPLMRNDLAYLDKEVKRQDAALVNLGNNLASAQTFLMGLGFTIGVAMLALIGTLIMALKKKP